MVSILTTVVVSILITVVVSILTTVLFVDLRIDSAYIYPKLKNKSQLDVTYFIIILIGSTCFGHYCAHHLELSTIMLITTLAVSFLVFCRLEVRCS